MWKLTFFSWAASRAACPLLPRESLSWSSKDACYTSIRERIIQNKRAVTTSFTRHAEKWDTPGELSPTAAEVHIRPSNGCLCLQNKVEFLKLTLPTSDSLIPHTPCLTWARNNSQALRQSLLTLASRSLLGSYSLPEYPPPFPRNQSSHALWRTFWGSHAFSGCCWVNVCPWEHGASNPYSLLN